MLKILFLLNVFHQAISYNINLYGMKIQAAGQNNLKISFHIRKEIDHLTGEFSAHHKDCPNGQCGSITTGKPSKENDQGKKFTIPLHHSLSRCKSYDRVEVRAAIWHGGQNKHSANWKASCPHLTTTTKTTTKGTTTQTTKTAKTTTTPASGPALSVVNIATVSIIVVLVIISSVIIVLAVTLLRRRRNRKQERAEEMPVDENPIYGIYEEEPVYNVVTDENAYYAT